jgi:hypothetical protein
MLTPTFRFFLVPLAAVGALAALSVQSAASRPSRDAAVSVREQVVDCSALQAGEVCVLNMHGN